MNTSKLSAYLMIGAGAVIVVLALAWTLSNANLETSARVLGIAIGVIVAVPVAGIGVYLLNKGTGEAAEDKVIARQRKLLNIVLTQGQVDIRTVSLELNVTRDEARELVRDLIGKQLFSGYVDWDGGMLYSSDAAKLKNGTCPKCSGKLELAGKGLVKCPFCGTEVFLS